MAVEEVVTQQSSTTASVTPVAVEVTTPDGKPGLVREDDKAPTFITPLHSTEV